MSPAHYVLELRIDGELIGDVRGIASGLQWTKRRTKVGVDSITFSVIDRVFSNWLAERGYTIAEVLRPLALDCTVLRDGDPVVGGFLAGLPSYSPNADSATLNLQFDGYMNLLDGVYLAPQATITGNMGTIVSNWIQYAENTAEAYGKGFGIKAGDVEAMEQVQITIENYKSIKDAITDRSDNVTGAGEFDVEFNPDRTYDIISSANYGETISDYTIYYPASINNVSAVDISADGLYDFASMVIAIGAGEVSDTASTAPTSTRVDTNAVQTYGFRQKLLQESSVSVQSTLDGHAETELAKVASPTYMPQITLMGRQVRPSQVGSNRIWIGDYIHLQNDEDMTGLITGTYRVNELQVDVEATGAEKITPTLEKNGQWNSSSFASRIRRIENELLAVKTAS